jgi:hypothetical protein
MWDERFAEVCARHRDLVAVYESRHGRLGLLFRQTLMPLSAERVEWLAETRGSARGVITDLRAAGFRGGTVVLQWVPIGDVARIVGRWVRRWDGDPQRRSQLIAAVERWLIDQRFLATRARATATVPEPAGERLEPEGAAPTVARVRLDDAGLDEIKGWYESMASHWLAIQPVRRRRLVLQTHVWIAERVLADPVSGPGLALKDLGADGALARALGRLVGVSEAAAWRRWIHAVRIELQRALQRPPAERNQGWARSLFLIPYSMGVPRRGRLRALPGGAAVRRPA